jgi:small-conductance mechanosensitive channel
MSELSGMFKSCNIVSTLGETMADSEAKTSLPENSFRIGLVGVIVIIIGVFAVLTIVLYTMQHVLGIPIPYPNITITVTWALIALVGVWILGHTIQTTVSPIIGTAAATSSRKVVTVILLVAILFATLDRLGIDLSAYLVSLGVTAIVIGFAAQATIGNLIAGMLVFVSKPFRRGDYVRVNITGAPIEGKLDQISLLRSRIVTNDGVSISVPNTVMLAVPISNFTIFEKRPIILSITLDRNISVEEFRSKMETVQVSTDEDSSERRLYVKGFDSETTTVEFWVQVATRNFLKERSLIVHSIQALCERENIVPKKIELLS